LRCGLLCLLSVRPESSERQCYGYGQTNYRCTDSHFSLSS